MLPRERSQAIHVRPISVVPGFYAEEPDDTNLIDSRSRSRPRALDHRRSTVAIGELSIMPPTGQGKQIETYLCAHVAVLCMGDRLISASLALGCRVASEPMAMPVAWCLVVVVVARSHWRTHVLVLARSIGFRRRALPIAEDFSACLLVLVLFRGSTTDSGTVGVLAWRRATGDTGDCNCHLGWAVGCEGFSTSPAPVMMNRRPTTSEEKNAYTSSTCILTLTCSDLKIDSCKKKKKTKATARKGHKLSPRHAPFFLTCGRPVSCCFRVTLSLCEADLEGGHDRLWTFNL